MNASSNDLTGTIRDVLHGAETLLFEMQLALDDLSRSSTSVELAIDCSELYAFALPTPSSAERFRAFPTEPRNTLLVLQSDALNHLCVDRVPAPILLSPYAVELGSILRGLRKGVFERVLTTAALAATERERLLRDSRVLRLLSARATGPEADVDNELLELVLSQAESFLLLLDNDFAAPVKRLEDLIRSGRLRAVPEAWRRLSPDRATTERWFAALMKIRGSDHEAACYADALGVGYLASYRRAGFTTPLFFVTRSRAMWGLLREEIAQGTWGDCQFFFRHPRMFTSPFRNAARSDEERSSLQGNHDALRVLVQFAKERLEDSTPIHDSEASELLAAIGDRLGQFLRVQVLASPATAVRLSRAKHSSAGSLLELVRALLDERAFMDLVEQRLDELGAWFQRDATLLSFLLVSDKEEERADIVQSLRPAEISEKIVLVPSKYWVPCSLQFSASALEEWARRLEREEHVHWSAVANLFEEGFQHADAERLLAMGYALAALKKWGGAERLAAEAVRLAGDGEPVRNEALFFHAVCLRMHEESVERFAQAERALKEALESKRRARDDQRYSDPRYLAELGTQYAQWARIEQNQGVAGCGTRVAEALMCWVAALDSITNDERLRVQVLNNLAFTYVEIADPADVDRALAYVTKAIDVQERLTADRRLWPPLFIDTIAAVYLRLETPEALEELRRVVPDLRYVLSAGALLSRHRKRLRARLEAVEARLGAGSLPASASLPA